MDASYNEEKEPEEPVPNQRKINAYNNIIR